MKKLISGFVAALSMFTVASRSQAITLQGQAVKTDVNNYLSNYDRVWTDTRDAVYLGTSQFDEPSYQTGITQGPVLEAKITATVLADFALDGCWDLLVSAISPIEIGWSYIDAAEGTCCATRDNLLAQADAYLDQAWWIVSDAEYCSDYGWWRYWSLTSADWDRLGASGVPATFTPTRTPTRASTFTPTRTRTPLATYSPTRTPTRASFTSTRTATRTPTRTVTRAAVATSTRTPTRTVTRPVVTSTRTPTRTATRYVTTTRTPTIAPTATRTTMICSPTLQVASDGGASDSCPPAPVCPDNIRMVEVVDLSSERQDWYNTYGPWGPGKTYGGIAARMQLEPIAQNFNSVGIQETVKLVSDTCGVTYQGNYQDLCRTGGGPGFVVGSSQRSLTTTLPSTSNSFWDLNAMQDNWIDNPSTPISFDFLSGTNWAAQTYGCQITCEQFYHCGSRNYGPYYITVDLSHGWFWTHLVTNVNVNRW